jgi:predicted amidohydrolase YtcJ
VVHRTGAGIPLGGSGLRLDPATALVAHTIAAARAAGTANRADGLESGKLADLMVLDADPVAAAPEQLNGIRVTQTWVGGTPATSDQPRLLPPSYPEGGDGGGSRSHRGI